MAEIKKELKPVQSSQYMSVLAKQVDTYTNMVIKSMSEIDLQCNDYQKLCVANTIMALNTVIRDNHLTFNAFNQDEVTSVLLKSAMLQLNASAMPKEMYVSIRKKYDEAKQQYSPTLEFGIEGNGNDAILRRFGVDVQRVIPPFIIREGDEFTYPFFDGEKMVPPTWKPKSFTAKAIAVCYIVEKTDGSKEYLISEREDVAKNLKAHIANNLLGAKNKDIRNQIIEKINDMSLDQMLSDPSLKDYISPAWRLGSSSEEMIVRKMKNNATKKYPKDFSNSFLANAYESTFEDYDQYRQENNDVVAEVNPADEVKQEIKENSQTIEVQPTYFSKEVKNEAVQEKAKEEVVVSPVQEGKPGTKPIIDW